MSKESAKIIKTYMSFTLPLDPAYVRTLVDLDLSYAFGETLVGWSSTREIVSGLAASWQFNGEREVTFKIEPSAHWSDGSAITAMQVVRSFARTKKMHGESLKSLFDIVTEIAARGQHEVVFKLNVPAPTSGIIRKLTEPMYGIFFVRSDESLDLRQSSGPFRLAYVSKDELTLTANESWIFHSKSMAEEVQIRRPRAGDELQQSFIHDSWANLLCTSSLIPERTQRLYEQSHFKAWRHNLDKIFFLSPGPRFTSSRGRAITRYLNDHLDRNHVVNNLSGFTLTNQFFPEGYALFNPQYSRSGEANELPAAYRSEPIVILGADSRLSAELQENLSKSIQATMGTKPIFHLVSLSDFENSRRQGNYDLMAASLPVNDPNIEGALEFFFGLKPPIIPNAGEGSLNFTERIHNAGSLPALAERYVKYRGIFADAIDEGCLLPLFHYSTMVIAKEGLDLSRVPTTDETVAFSKVKFK